MALWHRKDSLSGNGGQDKEMLLKSMEQAITDLELASIRQGIFISNLELAMQDIQKTGEGTP